MKPSEILDAVMAIDTEIADLKRRLEPMQDRLEVLGFARADIRTHLDRGDGWEKIEERLEDLRAGVIPDDPSDEPVAKRHRAPRSDKGKPRGPRPHVEPVKSPLTPELRAKLVQTLGDRALTIPEIKAFSWTAELSPDRIESLLCEDSTAFESWVIGDKTVWGLIPTFDRVVGNLSIPGMPRDKRPEFTAAALGCSLKAAVDSWKRLDPNE